MQSSITVDANYDPNTWITGQISTTSPVTGVPLVEGAGRAWVILDQDAILVTQTAFAIQQDA
jgi:hypothetical protein